MPIDLRPLSDEDQELIAFAGTLIDTQGDGDVGVHTMGAAVRDVHGRMYGGVNLFHFTGGPCAELVALGHARAEGARQLTTIVAVGDRGRGPVGPCGRDRQILFDYHPTIRVLLPTKEGVRSVRIVDLMPYAAAWSIDDGVASFDPSIYD